MEFIVVVFYLYFKCHLYFQSFSVITQIIDNCVMIWVLIVQKYVQRLEEFSCLYLINYINYAIYTKEMRIINYSRCLITINYPYYVLTIGVTRKDGTLLKVTPLGFTWTELEYNVSWKINNCAYFGFYLVQ